MLSQQNTPTSNMNALGTVYATKRRRRNGKSIKPQPKEGQTKSNPSKRHRERLNAELDNLAGLLPFEQNILSKLDRLSILRLAVSYLRTKSYFQVMMHGGAGEKTEGEVIHPTRHRDLITYDHQVLDGEMFLQALNGFLVILACEGEVFFATHNIESYLGFHQVSTSDIVHQSVYELVHSEQRKELQRTQLMWNSHLHRTSHSLPLQGRPSWGPDCIGRNFTVDLECLLDNTSGFLRLDVRGKIKVLHGQNRKTEEAPLALFAVCTPFGPPSLLELPQKEVMYKSKHKLDLSLVSMDQKGRMLLGYSDLELANKGGYDLVHYDDLAYVASAHQELLKTGASGMIAYRLQTRDGTWQWLQTSSRLVYKNSKPDFIICTHRPLMEEEGRDLLGKRTMDFKVSYLDPGLTQSYLCDSELPQLYASRMSRKYKTQLRDFLTTCRTKRSYTNLSDTAYNNYNNVYGASAYATDNGLYMQQNLGNLQSLYPASYIPADNLFHYRQLGSYYPDYMTHGYVSNGYVDPARPCLGYDSTGLTKTAADQKLYCTTQIDASKYQYKPADAYSAVYGTNTVLPALEHKYSDLRTVDVRRDDPSALASLGALAATPGIATSVAVSSAAPTAASATHKEESKETNETYANNTRQTVLMWGSASHEYDPNKKYVEVPVSSAPTPLDPSLSGVACKWGTATPASTPGARSSAGGSPHGGEGTSPHAVGPPTAHSAAVAAAAASAAHVGAGAVAPAGKAAYGYSEGGEVWHHQYYPYHPYHTPQGKEEGALCGSPEVTSDPPLLAQS
ncbi:LOW QUALITY PROTEIN: circadian locomoter output cycles protein kaput-like [Homarus americanus]|uniref:LOW QUALITY PROTEIN: circadian locomoter output cycles protein kaput-like n=1 Tax=Homarus americanus TaxID=6706 RepID=UPI001C46A406|nr:LOW QUALITY PROTEIN: circadian locomoter output cycles protein kaput-like [Homarus americanus]